MCSLWVLPQTIFNGVLRNTKRVIFFLLVIMLGWSKAVIACSSDETRHIISPGQTLQIISQQHFGTTRNWYKIYKWNQGVIQDADRLEVGEKICIRGGVRAQTWTVKPGDSLSKIAQNVFGDRREWKKIFRLNQDVIKNANQIEVGQVLQLGQNQVAQKLQEQKPVTFDQVGPERKKQNQIHTVYQSTKTITEASAAVVPTKKVEKIKTLERYQEWESP